MSQPCTQEQRIAQLEAMAEKNQKTLIEIKEALLGNKAWNRPGLIDRFEAVESAVRNLVETKSRALWLILALGAIAGTAASFATRLLQFIKDHLQS
jgi:hypothetical protein